MKNLRLILLLVVASLGVAGAYASTHKAKRKHSGYTEYHAINTYNGPGYYNYFHWSLTAPSNLFLNACVGSTVDSSCDIWVDNSYTPVDNIPIPVQYRECEDCTSYSLWMSKE